jgi:NADH-quinone oxidoreductase subunit H
MGVAAAAAGVLIALLVAAALTWAMELRFHRPDQEMGPAGSIPLPEHIDLPNADRWLLPAAPVMALIGVALGMVVIPIGPGLIGRDLGIGVFYFIVVIDFVVLGVALGGWGANTFDTVEAFYRIVAQLVAYVVPLGLALVGAIMMARSLSTVQIVEAQSIGPFILLQPIGFALYIVAGLMQSYRAPFLEPFSEHIRGGILSAMVGGSALIWRIAFSGVLLLVSAMGAVVFLGGWHGPWIPGWAWMVIKSYGLMVAMLWLGRQVRPLSTSEMLALSWKVLTPVGLINVLIVGALILLGVGPS